MVRYVSTRGEAPVLNFEEVLLAGLARDGGLYVPAEWPHFAPKDWEALAGLDYPALAARVMRPFVGDVLGEDEFTALVAEAYAGFDHAAITPLREIAANEWILDLFHGPTLAFKDVALQLLGRLFDAVLARRGERVTIVGATSGDTGSAAIEACRDRAAVTIFMLHPKGRTSDVQRRQMTTVQADNVFNIAIEGTFDDCQGLVKAMFNDLAFRDALRLSAVNSINWARVMAQIVYYVHAVLALGGRPLVFSVPTGNFGDVFAGYVAAQMGLPIARLIVATNVNDILARTFATGGHTLGAVQPTMSPSMDIQISSNFERLLFDLYGRDGGAVRGLMAGLEASGGFHLGEQQRRAAAALFTSHRVDEDQTLATIGAVYRQTGALIDPHTAVGVAAGRACRQPGDAPLVSLATAHPAKFPAAVEQATGIAPRLPARLADLMSRKERYVTLPRDLGAVQDYIRQKAAP